MVRSVLKTFKTKIYDTNYYPLPIDGEKYSIQLYFERIYVRESFEYSIQKVRITPDRTSGARGGLSSVFSETLGAWDGGEE